MSFAIAHTDEQWELVADLFDPPGRRGAPAVIPRRAMVDAMLFICRTGTQWRHLPERYPPWTAVGSQWRRWRASGVWAAAMTRLAAIVRWLHGREPQPRLAAIVGDRAYRGLARLARRKGLDLDIKAPPPGGTAFVPLRPLVKAEHAFAQLGRWRRLSRCYEGSEASAGAWLEVAAVGHLAWRVLA